MKKFIIILLLCMLVIPKNAFAIGESAEAITVMDMDSGRVLYSKNQNSKKLIASITKIMTSVVAIESGKINDIVKVDDSVLKSYGSGIYIKPGEEISLLDLVYGLMLRSGNDAAVMIATYVSGNVEDFVKSMNSKAKKIGMKNTEFFNPHGLDEESENKSSSYDMALLMSYAMQNDIFKQVVGTKSHKVTTNKNSYVWKNKNKLLFTYEYTTGGKTGFTERARRTLVTSASKNNLNITVVTLNDPSDFKEHKDAYEYVFENYTKYRILNKDTFNVKNNKFDGKLYIKNDYYYAIKENEKDKFMINVKLEKNKRNIKNNIAGVAQVSFDNRVIHEEKIYLDQKESSNKKGFFAKILGWFKW